MNLLRKRSKYQNGIKIWYYSKKENIENNIGWHHTNEDVKYYRNNLFRNSKGKRQIFIHYHLILLLNMIMIIFILQIVSHIHIQI